MAVAVETLEELRRAALADVDPDLVELIGRELERQRGTIELIASENFTWPSVFEAVGSVPTNKYAEGYPGRRYYGGCEVVDEIEQLAIDRAKTLFGAEHANVQPHAGAQTNMAVYFSCLQPGDTILAMRLDHGGHLTHGLKVNFSGKLYDVVGYGVDRETGLIDFDEVRRLAQEHRPKLIVCGASAYPRTIEADRFRADRRRGRRAAPLRHGPHRRARRGRASPEPGAALRLRHVDEPQDARRAARRASSSAGRSTRPRSTRRSSRACRAARCLHVIAAKATCFKIAASDAFRVYQRQIRANADALAASLLGGGLRPPHRRHGHAPRPGRPAPERVDRPRGGAAPARGAASRRTATRCPSTSGRRMEASGVRLGTPAVTMRGFDEDDLREVGEIIGGALGDGDLDGAARP